jgi:DNA polymerase III alpha subunit
VALCQDSSGYRNLTRIVTRSHTEGQTTRPTRPGWAPRGPHAGRSEGPATLQPGAIPQGPEDMAALFADIPEALENACALFFE